MACTSIDAIAILSLKEAGSSYKLHFAANEDGAEKGLTGSSVEMERITKFGKKKSKVNLGVEQTKIATSSSINLRNSIVQDTTSHETTQAGSCECEPPSFLFVIMYLQTRIGTGWADHKL